MGILLALITYFGWGTGDIFSVIATRKIGAYLTTFYVFLFGFILASMYIPFALVDFPKITLILLVANLIMGSAYLMGNFFVAVAFKESSASLVGIIIQSFPAVVLVLSSLIFKDPITQSQILWIAFIFIGVFLCSINFDDLKKGQLFADKGVRYALVATAIFSIYFTFLRVFADAYGWFWPNYISFASFPLVLFLARYFFKIKEKIVIPKDGSILVVCFLSALLLRGGDIALNFGIGNGYSSIVTSIAGASPTLFIALSSFIFKDKVTMQQKIGIGISLVGIVLLSFFS